MDVKVKKDLLEIKDIIRKPVKTRNIIDEAEQIVAQLTQLHQKVDELHTKFVSNKDSAATLKRKKQVISILKQSKQLTAAELGQKLKLSRTRCSEYLNELAEEGIISGVQKGRRKYFKLAG